MTSAIDLETFRMPAWLNLSCGTMFAFLITWISIPTIVKIAKFKKLNASINERTSHNENTPNLGGLAVFAGYSLSIIIFLNSPGSEVVSPLIGGIIVLFLIGIKDDILIIDPKKKLLGQIFASMIVIWLGGIRITSFYSAFGIGDISTLSGIIFTLFLFLLIINGFNLLDGIDGLASGMGIVISLVYGTWFILANNLTYAILSLSLVGALIAFFRFNVFSVKNKIFLGDTGSMLMGLVIAVLTVKFIESESIAPAGYQIDSAPAVAFALVIVPLLDMLRVFILRLSNGISPFKADRNHIHHMFLSLGFSHLGTTMILIAFTLLFLLFAVLMQNTGIVTLITVMTLLATILLSVPWLVVKIRQKS